MIQFYCESFGCQMNAYDTEVISTLLEKEGCVPVGLPDEADVIIVNTCSVRGHADVWPNGSEGSSSS